MIDPKAYPAIVRPLSAEDGGGYLALAPDLPGCRGDGETPEAAIRDLHAAILEWCDEVVRLGRPLPAPGSALEKAGSDRAALLDPTH